MIVPVALSSILLTSCKPPSHRTQKGVGTSIEFDLDSIQDVPYSQDTRVSGVPIVIRTQSSAMKKLHRE